MSTDIKCPNCGNTVSIEEAVSEEYKRELREKMREFQKKQEEEFQKQRDELARKEKTLLDQKTRLETDFNRQLAEEKLRLQQTIESGLRKTITTDFENKIRILEQQSQEREETLRQARKKELEFLQKEQALISREKEMEIEVQKQLLEGRNLLAEQIRKEESDRVNLKETEYQLKLRELEKQLDDQKKLADEMRRKAEQGSMQLQGEAQELLLEEILKNCFPFDSVVEVGKGVEGADCMLIIRNAAGTECGKIIFESKRARGWQNVWIDKLKNDMRSTQADLAILVTQVFPKGMDCFGEKDGVWLCSFKEVSGLAAALRNAIIRIAETRRSEENKGEKMQLLYNFLTGIEFRQQVEAIVEGFVAMKNSITKERVQMEKLWKEREKQLDKVLLSTSGMYGSIKGIAGASISNIPLLEGNDESNDDDMAH